MERLDDKTLGSLIPELNERLTNARQRGDDRSVKLFTRVKSVVRETMEKRAYQAKLIEAAARRDAQDRADNVASMSATVDGFMGQYDE